MSQKDGNALPYRPCVGIMLVNNAGKVFVAQRKDNKDSQWRNTWQMPQGGVDEGEDIRSAALRELEEETSVPVEKVTIITQSNKEHFYDLPDELIGKLWKGKWRGQRQFWFLMRFLGHDNDINIDTEIPEFDDWKWCDINELADNIVLFKRDIYAALTDEFSALIL